ncbi:MAG: Rieske (2Fe-2S) protein [Planctomycetota bacterium]
MSASPSQQQLPFPDDGRGPWVRVAGFDELEDGYGLARAVEGRELALFRDGEAVHCFEDLCPHRGAPLSDGHLAHGEVVCPWHGWRYAAADGSCTTLPGSQGARRFDCRRDGDGVWVRLRETHPGA